MPEFSPEILQFIQASWPIVLMGVIFYFLLYRPQQKEQKKRTEMLNALKKGDRIVTIGGIYGTITAINDKVVTLKVADKVEIEIARTAVSHHQNPQKNGNNK
ncbi:preprotein translocase, YajC subunit [Thermosinus carboxydivorans Nor1]|uniref:Preprotein translocase, YajC subunit n=1 Tax=Thermosinus carboxydivorans Nor1 TaxID=401526 RepID=A1HT81_9FIRM|nr:preprotein translocase subunit YajC [Thermosinus carboxydivorans]EAX46759.1 preprotein translocase, YajC subunit [Thermosinus carboxydivorans Nor1]